MIARPIFARAAIAVAGMGLLHVIQQCVAGFVQCGKLGCLPW